MHFGFIDVLSVQPDQKGLNQVDIITYDELLERANHIVGKTMSEHSPEGYPGAPYGNSSSHQVGYSDLPF